MKINTMIKRVHQDNVLKVSMKIKLALVNLLF